MFCRSCSSVLFQRGNLTMFSPMLLSFVWLALFSFNSCWLYSVVPFCRVVYTVVVYICSVYLVVRLLFSCARLLTVSNCLDGYACWLYSVVLLHPVVDCMCLRVTSLKMWWPTPFFRKLTTPSVLYGDKVNSVPPRTGLALCAKWWQG